MSLGDYKTEAVRGIVEASLRRVQTIVANVKENMKLYRAEHSWLHAFTAFRLPSPLSATDAAGATEAEAGACLKRICREAFLPPKEAIAQLGQLLKRAEWHHQRDGCTTRQAWGRAAAEWPELHIGRRLVELFLIWKTSSGNLERRFRRFAEVHCPERARLLDTSVEDLSMVDQAPSSKLLRMWLEQQERSEPGEAHGLQSSARRWFQRVLRLHERVQGPTGERRPKAARRDKGIERELRPDGDTEAAFGRKRAAAIDAIVAASPSKRRRILADGAPVLAALARETAQGRGEDRVIAAATVSAAVAKREGKARERYLGGAKAAAKARSAREKKVLRSPTPGPAGRDADLATAPPRSGIMLVRMRDQEARRKARRLSLKLVRDPLEFLGRLGKQNTKAARERGNVVLVAAADSDFAIAAQIAAAFVGAFFTTPIDFSRQDSPRGIQYTEKLRSSTTTYHVAVTADLQADLPTLPHLLRSLAQSPSGCVKFYLKPEKLCKFFKKHAKGAPRLALRCCVLCRPGEERDVEKGCQQLYQSPSNWVLPFDASVKALCPGTKAVTLRL